MNFIATLLSNLTNFKRYSFLISNHRKIISSSKINFHFLNFDLLHEDSISSFDQEEIKSLEKYSIKIFDKNLKTEIFVVQNSAHRPLILNHESISKKFI